MNYETVPHDLNTLESAKEAEGNKPKISHEVVLQPSLHKNKLSPTERKKFSLILSLASCSVVYVSV